MKNADIQKELENFKEYVLKSATYINLLVQEVDELKGRVIALENKNSTPKFDQKDLDEFYGLEEEE